MEDDGNDAKARAGSAALARQAEMDGGGGGRASGNDDVSPGTTITGETKEKAAGGDATSFPTLPTPPTPPPPYLVLPDEVVMRILRFTLEPSHPSPSSSCVDASHGAGGSGTTWSVGGRFRMKVRKKRTSITSNKGNNNNNNANVNANNNANNTANTAIAVTVIAPVAPVPPPVTYDADDDPGVGKQPAAPAAAAAAASTPSVGGAAVAALAPAKRALSTPHRKALGTRTNR